MNRPRLVATDLDGTLVHSDGSITPRTRDALLAAEAAGLAVVFVTGRPLRWAAEVFEHVGGHGLAIISNGASWRSRQYWRAVIAISSAAPTLSSIVPMPL